MKMPRLIVRALEVAGTACVFALASQVSELFSLPSGASFLFPPAGVSLAAGAAFGARGVAGVVLGVVAIPWGAAATVPGMALFSVVNGLAAALPAWALRRVPASTALRLRRVFLWGGLLNNLASAAAGSLSLALLGRLPWEAQALANNFFSWWTSDLMAALVIGLPALLWLRPEVLMTEPHQGYFRAWLRHRPALVEAGLLTLAGLLSIALVERLGWAFPHWLAISLVLPVALAAVQGGVGPAVLVSSVASAGYLAVLVATSGWDSASLHQTLAPAYTAVGVCSLFALVGGWLAGRNRRLLEAVRAHQRQLERDFDATVASLAAAIEAKDPTTEGHVQRVAHLAVLVGRRLGLTERELKILRYGAMLHDVGKIGVPEKILNKPGGLTPAEKEEMEAHVEIGLRIIRDVEMLRDVDPLIRYHQERWDGARTGVRYPGYFGLAGEQIPLGARILSVVDAFDAITHDRPYRRGASVEVAVAELHREAGRQFDPRLVDVLIRVLQEERWLVSTAELRVAAVAG